MPLNLVNYSDSEDSTSEQPPAAKRARKSNLSTSTIEPESLSSAPPLPPRFYDLYTTTPRLAARDDPSLHGGRKRAIPHVEGNWPTHVFIEWHLDEVEFNIINRFISRVRDIITQFDREQTGIPLEDEENANEQLSSNSSSKKQWNSSIASNLYSSLLSDLNTQLPLHLSLSRPNILQSHERASFMELLQSKIKKSAITSFFISFSSFEWVSNFDRTRHFFVMKAASPHAELPTLLRLTNASFAPYGQAPLYSHLNGTSAGFHVTVGWSLEYPSEELRMKTERIATTEFRKELEGLKMHAENVKVKIGNTVHVFGLGKGPV